MFLSGFCVRDANNVQSKATGLRREQEGRLKIRLFFVHPGGRAFCFIVYVVRNLVEKDGEGWRRMEKDLVA